MELIEGKGKGKEKLIKFCLRIFLWQRGNSVAAPAADAGGDAGGDDAGGDSDGGDCINT